MRPVVMGFFFASEFFSLKAVLGGLVINALISQLRCADFENDHEKILNRSRQLFTADQYFLSGAICGLAGGTNCKTTRLF
jgi:hypothetical protein